MVLPIIGARYRQAALMILSVVFPIVGICLMAVPSTAQDDAGDGASVDTGLVHPAVASYAGDYSVSLQIAEQNLERIPALQAIMTSIIDLESSRVAGTGVDHGADMRGWVWLTGDGSPSPAAARIADAHDDIEIRVGAAHTYQELRAAQDLLDFDTIGEMIGDSEAGVRISDMVVYTAVDVDTNSVEIGIDPAQARTRGRRSTTPVSVSDEQLADQADWITSKLKNHIGVGLVIGDGRGIDLSADFVGGYPIGRCTAGFAAKQVGGPYGIITAGHCDDVIYMNEVRLPHIFGWKSQTADAQFHMIPLPADPEDEDSYHNLSNTYLCIYRTLRIPICNVKGDIARTDMTTPDPDDPDATKGEYVCHTGANSGLSCGEITNTELSPVYRDDDDACVDENGSGVDCDPVFIRVSGPSLKQCGGDSGGPWFNRWSIAYGIHKGGSGRTDCTTEGKIAIFSAVREVEDFLGVDVLTAPPSSPGSPVNVRTAFVGSRYVRVSWNAPSSGAAGYIVYRRDGPGGPRTGHREIARTSMEADYDPDRFFYDDLSGLSPGTKYSYRIKAVDNLGAVSTRSNAAEITVPLLPGPPRNLAASILSGNVRVTWTAPGSGVDRYFIYRRIAKPGHKYYPIASTYDTHYDDPLSGLNAGAEYYYRVKAVNELNQTGSWGPGSNYAAITTPSNNTVPGPPRDVVASLINSYVRVGWNSPTTGAAEYNVYRRIAKKGYQYTKITTTTNTYYYDRISALNPKTEYYYRVKAVNSQGQVGKWGPGSNYGAVTTP